MTPQEAYESMIALRCNTVRLARPKNRSRKTSKWPEQSRERFMNTVSTAIDLAAHARSALWTGEYDLSALTDQEKYNLRGNWEGDVQSIIDMSITHLKAQEGGGVEICKPLSYVDGINWSKAISRLTELSSNQKPKFTYADLKNLSISPNSALVVTEDEEGDMGVAASLVQGILLECISKLREIPVPSHSIYFNFPSETEDQINQDRISDLSFRFRSTKDIYGERLNERVLTKDDQRVFSQIVKGALETASRIREFERNVNVSNNEMSTTTSPHFQFRSYSGPLPADYHRQDLVSILSKLNSLNGMTTQQGQTLSFGLDPDSNGDYEPEIRLADLPVPHQVPLPLNSQSIQHHLRSVEAIKSEFTYRFEEGLSFDVADRASELYKSGRLGAKKDVYLLLCEDILQETISKTLSRRVLGQIQGPILTVSPMYFDMFSQVLRLLVSSYLSLMVF
ncbi:hypothetical protein I204_05985 [Kwoniella mangroviensis CBS 8886]|nr:hypothetical protein I204_05985 [Kwoniella mangroviensis CBS 8886]